MQIILIRHGQQDSELCGADAALSASGREQAELAGLRLENAGVDALYSSTLLRAAQTAEIIGRHIGLPVRYEEDLREIDYGRITGLGIRERFTRYADFYEKQSRLTSDLPYPDGECLGDVYRRVCPVMTRIAKSGADCAVVVSHGEAIRAFLAGILGMDFARGRQIAVGLENTSFQRIEYRPETGLWYVRTIGDASHLAGRPDLLRKKKRI